MADCTITGTLMEEVGNTGYVCAMPEGIHMHD